MAVTRKHLLLIRHAKTLQALPGQADFERELAAKGERQCALMRDWLNGQLPAGHWQVLCSPAMRTRQTWEHCQPQPMHSKVSLVDAIYGGSRGELCDLLAEQFEQHERLVLIGHNPVISELLAMLAQDDKQARMGFGTGDMALLHNDQGHLYQAWQLDWLYRP